MSVLSASARLWRWFANGSGVLFAALLCAQILNRVSEGAGAVIAVDGPPQSKVFEYRGPDRTRTLRVPLGGKVEYDLPWRIIEGGCDRWIVRTWARPGDGQNAFTLTQRMKRPPYPIGKPGLDHISADMPDGISPGLWRYRAVGETDCRTRKPPPILFAEFDVEVYDPDGPVVTTIGKPVVAQPVVPEGGSLAYRISFERFEATPSEILNTYSRLDPSPLGTPDLVFERRPTSGRGIGRHVDIDVVTPLPAAVRAGRWKLRQVIITNRPGGKTRIDHGFEIEFEVAG